MHRIDCLQYCNWSEKIFRQMREGGVDAVHVTIAYHEMFREMVANVEQWHGWFCLLYTSPSPRDAIPSRMPSSA